MGLGKYGYPNSNVYHARGNVNAMGNCTIDEHLPRLHTVSEGLGEEVILVFCGIIVV